MWAFMTIVKEWVYWVNKLHRKMEKDHLFWDNGWRTPFWFRINIGWHRMGDARFQKHHEAEALWDPQDNM